jgi:hypothetical protein
MGFPVMANLAKQHIQDLRTKTVQSGGGGGGQIGEISACRGLLRERPSRACSSGSKGGPRQNSGVPVFARHHAPLTHPISIESEDFIVRSLWWHLRSTPDTLAS